MPAAAGAHCAPGVSAPVLNCTACCLPFRALNMQEWCQYTAKGTNEDDVQVTSVAGNHLWPIAEPTAKAAWLQEVAVALKEAL